LAAYAQPCPVRQLTVTYLSPLHGPANGKRDFTAQFNYTHVSALNNGSLFGSIEIPIFDSNQGEIARIHVAIDEAQQTEQDVSDQVLTDVQDAYAAVQTSAQALQIYKSGHLKEAQESRDISQYAYRRRAGRTGQGAPRCQRPRDQVSDQLVRSLGGPPISRTTSLGTMWKSSRSPARSCCRTAYYPGRPLLDILDVVPGELRRLL
jgi:hypothetical protein